MAADLKMYCIFSQEAIDKMQGNRGKMAAQAGHAYLHAWWDAVNKAHRDSRLMTTLANYFNGDDARKICLITPTDDDLRRLVDAYQSITGVTLVEDCGYTIFEPGTLTVTCAGIGPLYDADKGDDLRNLELFS